ncbi:hypothetical protein ACVPOR_00175 [Staphylococcus aureus]
MSQRTPGFSGADLQNVN